MTAPVLHLLAGPNGAGKSTFMAEILAPLALPFINADEIAARHWPDAQPEHAYDASRAAAVARERLLTERRSFITETVFSHPSKIELVSRAAALGYIVHLHVILVPEALPVPRVAHRVAQGGHDVPEEKVRERYLRLWPLVAAVRGAASRSTFYANSRADRPFRIVARYEQGRLIGHAVWPSWTPAALMT